MPWIPTDKSGLFGWMKPESLSGSDGDRVASVTDSSPSAAAFVQASADLKPTLYNNLLNGYAGLRFDDATYIQRLANGTSKSSGGTGRTFFIVCKVTDAGFGGLTDSSNNSSGLTILSNAGTAPYYQAQGDSRYFGGTLNLQTTYHLLIVVYDGGGATDADKLKAYRDGAQVTGTFSGAGSVRSSLQAGTNLTIGGVSYSLKGDIIEWGIYDSAVSGSELTSLTDYAKEKYWPVSKAGSDTTG